MQPQRRHRGSATICRSCSTPANKTLSTWTPAAMPSSTALPAKVNHLRNSNHWPRSPSAIRQRSHVNLRFVRQTRRMDAVVCIKRYQYEDVKGHWRSKKHPGCDHGVDGIHRPTAKNCRCNGCHRTGKEGDGRQDKSGTAYRNPRPRNHVRQCGHHAKKQYGTCAGQNTNHSTDHEQQQPTENMCTKRWHGGRRGPMPSRST